VVVGAYNKNHGRGAAYVYSRSTTPWTQQKLDVPNLAENDNFGWSVAIDRDTLIVGAYGTSGLRGAAYIFVQSQGKWLLQQAILPAGLNVNDQFGASVAISGDTAVIGAMNYTGSGAIFFYTRKGTTWTLQQWSVANDRALNDRFGYALAIDGPTLVVGAYAKNIYQGSAYIFAQSGQTWKEVQRLTASDGAKYDYFGWSVAISGPTIAIGAYGFYNYRGAIYIFTKNGVAWSEHQRLTTNDGGGLGVSVALSGEALAASANGADNSQGAVMVYRQIGQNWSLKQKLIAVDGIPYDYLGSAVAIANRQVLAGANYQNEYQGAIYDFAMNTTTESSSVGVYKAGVWYLRNTNTTGQADLSVVFGGDPSDLPIVGDWSGAGIDTLGVYRSDKAEFILSSSNASPSVAYRFFFGDPGDTPVSGRWEATMSHDSVGVYRPSNGVVYLKRSLTTGFGDYAAVFGNSGDLGVVGDWDGDGLDSFGVYRPLAAQWYLSNNSQPDGIVTEDNSFIWPIGPNEPVVGDWLGDGITRLGYVTASGDFVLHTTMSSTGQDLIFSFGPSGGMPVAGHWAYPSLSSAQTLLVKH
jgi:hypothetical protein